MCNPASMVINKRGKVFWSMYTDSHTEIITEFELNEDRAGSNHANIQPNFVKVEIVPPTKNGTPDFAAIPSKWVYKLDEHRAPGWYTQEKYETIARKALKDWIKARVIKKGSKEIKDGYFFVINSTVKALDNSTVKALGNSTVEAWGNSTVEALGNSTVEAWGNSTVEALGNSTVKAWGNSTVEAWGNSTVKALGNSTVEALGNRAVCISYNKQNVEPVGEALLIDRTCTPQKVKGNFSK